MTNPPPQCHVSLSLSADTLYLLPNRIQVNSKNMFNVLFLTVIFPSLPSWLFTLLPEEDISDLLLSVSMVSARLSVENLLLPVTEVQS